MTVDPDDPGDKPSFIPADHLAAIGRIVNVWAALEFEIDRTTWRLAVVPNMVGACMTAQMLSIQPKMRALIALAELRGLGRETIAKLNRFNSKDIGGLQEGRNRAVHDTRVIHAHSGVNRLQVTAQGTLVFGFNPEPVAELHITRKKIEAVLRKFQGMRDNLIAELATLPENSGRELLDIHSHGPAD